MKEKDTWWWAYQMSALMIIVWKGLNNRALVVMGLSLRMSTHCTRRYSPSLEFQQRNMYNLSIKASDDFYTLLFVDKHIWVMLDAWCNPLRLVWNKPWKKAPGFEACFWTFIESCKSSATIYFTFTMQRKINMNLIYLGHMNLLLSIFGLDLNS